MNDEYIKIPLWTVAVFGSVAFGYAIGSFVGFPKTGMVLMPIFYGIVKIRAIRKERVNRETHL